MSVVVDMVVVAEAGREFGGVGGGGLGSGDCG